MQVFPESMTYWIGCLSCGVGRWKSAQSPGDGAEFAVDAVVFCMGGHSGFGLRLLEETDDLSALLSTANDPRVSSSSEALWLVSKLHAGGDD